MSTDHKRTEPTRSNSAGLRRLSSGPRRQFAISVSVILALTAAATGCGSDANDAAATTPATTPATTATTVSPATTDASPSTTEAPASSEPSASTDTTEASTETTAASTVDFDAAAYCSAEVDLEVVGAGTGDPSEDPVAVATALLAAAEPVAALAPPELADDFDTALAALNTAIDDADPAAIESIDLEAIHDYGTANCGWTPVGVDMTSYHFAGIPATIAAGDYSFQVTNSSPEPHVMIIVRKKDGVTASWDELLAAPEGQDQVETVAAAFAVTGDTAGAVTRLEPGEYLALCPISQGTTLETEGTGPPHFTLGMKQIITVTDG